VGTSFALGFLSIWGLLGAPELGVLEQNDPRTFRRNSQYPWSLFAPRSPNPKTTLPTPRWNPIRLAFVPNGWLQSWLPT